MQYIEDGRWHLTHILAEYYAKDRMQVDFDLVVGMKGEDMIPRSVNYKLKAGGKMESSS